MILYVLFFVILFIWIFYNLETIFYTFELGINASLNFFWRFFTRGPCEVCSKMGWKQFSIVDPGSPALKIFCEDCHEKNRSFPEGDNYNSDDD